MTLLLLGLGCVDKKADDAAPCFACETGNEVVPITDTGTRPIETAETAETAETDTHDTVETAVPDSGETGGGGDTAVASFGPPMVILFIGDGMGPQHVIGGGLYAYGAAGSLVMETLPYQGKIVTASKSGVTDSAAAATAMASGEKTWNNVVGEDADGRTLTSLLEHARARGLAGGVVTTDTLTGATPAGFYAHTATRFDTEEIAAQLAANPPEVALGGGFDAIDPELASVDVQRVATRDELLTTIPDGRPFVGLFSANTFPYVADGYTTEPSLAEMTTAALDILAADPDGFFLMVEGARIDHASHQDDGERVHQETAAFDEAIAAALGWVGSRDVTILVTADHECGGLQVSGGGTAGTIPDSTWRWTQHTNADVPIYGMGRLADTFDGQRLDDTWIHAVLEAAIDGDATVTAPTESLLVDGRTDDEGAVVTTQTWNTSFGAGYNQLDGLRVTADADGLWVGVDGVFEFGANTTLLLLDLDYGAGTGLGADGTTLEDTAGLLDSVITTMPYTSGVAGMGFDLVFGAVGGEEIQIGDLRDEAGLRGMTGDWGSATDYWWLDGLSNFDDGNLANGGVAVDAGATGATANGWEIRIPWESVYPSGIPAAGTTVGMVAVLADDDGSYASNQALPPLASATEPGESTVLLESAVVLTVDGTGTATGPAAVVP